MHGLPASLRHSLTHSLLVLVLQWRRVQRLLVQVTASRAMLQHVGGVGLALARAGPLLQ
jgi:hypothetical protein